MLTGRGCAGKLRPMSDLLILIPAAGASTRMRGGDKLMEMADGVPVLVRQVRRALATGSDVVVTLSQDHPDRHSAVSGLNTPALTLVLIDGREGMAVSLRRAAQHARAKDYQGLMILPADMPDLDTDDLVVLSQSFACAPNAIHRATSAEGRPGHPVIFPQRLFAALEQLSGDQGGRDLTSDENLCFVALPDDRALIDLDTPEDWANWRMRQ